MLRTGDHAVHAPLAAEYFRQGTGVYPLDARDVVFFQVVVQRLLTAEIASNGGEVTDHKGLRPGTAGLVVLMVDAVVPDEGIGHHDPLSRVGGVGQDLLIPGHRGVEHHLAHPVGGTADAGPGKYASVGQDQSRFHQFSHTPFRSSSQFRYDPRAKCFKILYRKSTRFARGGGIFFHKTFSAVWGISRILSPRGGKTEPKAHSRSAVR